ncbi:MAG: Cof-type HAD-IIB family hydrolase [Clostridia bacterium]|nr:Cof-type HAD-IIB family hydrolase [Clostridia bacterium]
MSIRMVAVDLDGTLLDSKMNITTVTRQAIRKALTQGIEVVICTGRVRSECSEVFQMVPELRYAVICSGAQILNLQENRSIYADGFSCEQARSIYEILSRYDCIIDYGADGTFHNDRAKLNAAESYVRNARIANWLRATHKEHDDLGRFVSEWNGKVEKIHAYFSDIAQRDAALDALRVLPYDLATSAEVDLEAMLPGIDKGTGLGRLAAHLGIARDEVLAVGDSGNDEKMLTWAGVSAVVGNASEDMKKLSDLVAPGNDEDGVAWLLEKVMRGEL